MITGGLKTGTSFVQSNQISINVDTARAGWWSGGILHFTLQSRYGSLPDKTLPPVPRADLYGLDQKQQ